jgi:hypothetical protein
VPKGPNGEKRPADAIGLAVMIGKIATGEIEDAREATSAAASVLGRKGGKARASKLSAEERTEIARKGANARWRTTSDA